MEKFAWNGGVSLSLGMLARNLEGEHHLAFMDEAEKESRKTLIEVARNDELDVVKQMLKDGADVDEKNEFGDTPLMRAAWVGNSDVAKLLEDKDFYEKTARACSERAENFSIEKMTSAYLALYENITGGGKTHT